MIIAQISDPHITLGNGETERASRKGAELQRAVAHLMAVSPQPDLVIISGDCVEHGHADEYTRFKELLRPLAMPVYVIPGNHDDRARMLEMFGPQGAQPLPGFVQYVLDAGPVRLIALDTNVPGRGGGYLCSERLQWLEERLAQEPARPTIVFMHHPPVRTGMAVLDEIGLNGADAFEEIITRHPQIERIVAGHVHMAMLRRFAGTVVMTCPATGHSMLPDMTRREQLAVVMEPPACLLHVWHPNTGLVTHTSVIGNHGPLMELHDGRQWLL